MAMYAFILLPFLFISSLAAQADPQIRSTGKVYASREDTKPLFNYENTTIIGDAKKISKTIYTDPQGKVVVEEETEYAKNTILRYSYKQIQTKEEGEVKIENGLMRFNFTADGEKKEDTSSIEENLVTPDSIPNVIQKNWADLMSGESARVRFLLVERLETIGFKFYKDEERICRGIPAVDFIMKPTSMIIAALVPKIHLTFEKAPPHRLLESFGRLPVRVPEVPNPKTRKDLKALDGLLVRDL